MTKAPAPASNLRALLDAQAKMAAQMAEIPEDALLAELEAVLREQMAPVLNDVIRLAEAMPGSRVANHVAQLANMAGAVRGALDQRVQEIEQARPNPDAEA